MLLKFIYWEILFISFILKIFSCRVINFASIFVYTYKKYYTFFLRALLFCDHFSQRNDRRSIEIIYILTCHSSHRFPSLSSLPSFFADPSSCPPASCQRYYWSLTRSLKQHQTHSAGATGSGKWRLVFTVAVKRHEVYRHLVVASARFFLFLSHQPLR